MPDGGKARLIQGARTALSARYFGEMIEPRGHGCPRSVRENLNQPLGKGTRRLVRKVHLTTVPNTQDAVGCLRNWAVGSGAAVPAACASVSPATNAGARRPSGSGTPAPLAGSWRAPFRFFSACIGTMNLKRVSPSESRRAFSGSWKACTANWPSREVRLIRKGRQNFALISGCFPPTSALALGAWPRW